ncbi:MAG: hypothetical protein WCQ16_09550 [Verrucomicrobiae bacterium]
MTTPTRISVTSPLGPAIEWTRRMLFRPFDLGKWFVLGFSAWLAGLGERGGFYRGNYQFHTARGNGIHFRHEFERIRDYVMANLSWILPLAIGLMIVLMALGVLFLWFNSRGKFLFLHCVALDKADVAEPWHKFARQADSLFWFRLWLGLAGMALTLPLFVIAGVLIFRMFLHNEWGAGGIARAAGMVVVMFSIGLVLAIIKKFTMDFVVPIMFLRGKRCWDAWREFSDILRGHAGKFLLYLLFQVVIAIAVGAIVVATVLITCCMAGCVLALPYLGTVLLLPVLIFKRSYSLLYLAQYGREYDVFPLSYFLPSTGAPSPRS